MKKGQKAFTPLALEDTEAIRNALPGAGLAEEPAAQTPAGKPEYLQTILDAHQSSHEVVALYEISQSLASSLDVRDTLGLVVNKIERIIPFETCVVYLCDEAGGAARVQHVTGLHAESFRGRAVRAGEGVTGWVIANNKPFANTDPALDLSVLGSDATGYRTLAVCPLVKGDKKIGALALYSQTLDSYFPDQLRLLGQIAGLISDALHNAMRHAETRTNNLTDDLTGLPNARYFYAAFEQERVRALDDMHPLTLVTMDMDDFKRVNGTLGQTRGDEILKDVAALMRAQLRSDDIFIRYAGDKFIALFRNASPETISEITVRIQTKIAMYQPAGWSAEACELGISIGQARFKQDGTTLEELLEASNKRLQSDKAAHHSFSQFALSSSGE